MLLGFAPLTPLRKTSTSLRSAQDDRLKVYFELPLTYTATCHPEQRTLMGDMQREPSKNGVLATERSGVGILRRSRFPVPSVGIALVFSKVNFVLQKRSFTCLASSTFRMTKVFVRWGKYCAAVK